MVTAGPQKDHFFDQRSRICITGTRATAEATGGTTTATADTGYGHPSYSGGVTQNITQIQNIFNFGNGNVNASQNAGQALVG